MLGKFEQNRVVRSSIKGSATVVNVGGAQESQWGFTLLIVLNMNYQTVPLNFSMGQLSL